MTWLKLPIMRELGSLLVYFISGYAISMLALRLWKRGGGRISERVKRRLKQWLGRTRLRGGARWWPIAFAATACGVLIIGARKLDPPVPISVEHNVAILALLGHNEWRMRSDEEGTFVYRACSDFDNSSVIQVGFIADRAVWKEYGKCKSIRDTGLGFYYREGHDDWRIAR